MPVQIEGGEDYKEKYRTLKKKLKLLIYENECFQEELRKAQRALLKVRRDKSFLLDRLLQYHRGPDSSSDSEQTDDSDPDNDSKTDAKRKRLCPEGTSSTSASHQSSSSSSKPSSSKKKKSISSSGSSKGSSTPSSSSRPKQMPPAAQSSGSGGGSVNRRLANLGSNKPATSNSGCSLTEGQMTREEIERQLAARESINDFTTVSLTVPTQMFSMEGTAV